MDREERAKQFMPFAALKGYPEALRKKEKLAVDKKELSEEYKEALSARLRQIKKNDMITVVYYENQEYIKLSGRVSGIDEAAGVLKLVNKKISFENLLEVEGEFITDS